jgi:spore coat polysaccharide biosynthesis protein SpsF
MSAPIHPVVAVVQTRMTSSRLPGKVLKPLAGAPLIRRTLERVLRIEGLDAVVVALAEGPAHDAVIPALDGLNVAVVRGSEADVLARTAVAARAAKAATIMRVTSDCPLIDPQVSERVLAAYVAGRAEGIRYARTAFDSGYPHGFDTEVFDAGALYEAEAKAIDPYEREHATPYIWRRPKQFPMTIIDAQPNRRDWRLVVDTPDDYRLISAIYDALYPRNPNFGLVEIAALFKAQPELRAINAHVGSQSYVGLG